MKIAKTVNRKVLNLLKLLMSHLVKLSKSLTCAFISFIASIETICKKSVWTISFIIFLIAIFLAIFNAWQKTAYVYPINLPENAIKTGLSSENLTERIIINVQKLTSLKESNNSNYLNQLKVRTKLGVESGSCLTPFAPEKYAIEISRVINFHIQKSPLHVEVKLADATFSISDLAEYLKYLFNRSSIAIKPSIIWSDKDKGYLVQVTARYNSNFSHSSKLTAKDLQQAEDNLTLLLLKYINPAIYASIMFETYPHEALEGITLATDHLQEYKEISSPITLKGFLYLDSTKLSEALINQVKAQSYFEEAIKKNELDFEAKIGLLILEGSKLRKADTDGSSETYKKAIYDKAKAIADGLISKKKYLAEAYTLKSQLYDTLNRQNERLEVLKRALNELPNNPLLQSAYIAYLLDTKRLKDAENYLKSTRSNLSDISKDPYHQSLQFVKFRLLLERGEFARMFWFSMTAGDCVLGHLPESLYREFLSEKDSLKKKHLQRIIPSYFAEADRSGIKGLTFYSVWAEFLSSTNNFEDALSKYKKALEYPGEHRWTWLNMAEILNKQEKYKEAELHAKKSISLGLTGAALSIYLEAVFFQKDYQRFVNEYKSWKIPISVDRNLNMRFLILHGFAECYLGNMDEAKSVLEETRLYNKIYSEFETKEEIAVSNELYIADLRNLERCIYK